MRHRDTCVNVYLALDHDLDVMPVINKIDLPSAEPERVINEIEDVIGIEAQDAPQISAKTGLNVEEVLEQIVAKDSGTDREIRTHRLQALIFDSKYDSYKGSYCILQYQRRNVSEKGQPIRMMATGARAEVVEVGYFGAGQFIPCDELDSRNGWIYYSKSQKCKRYPCRRYDH
ncbi:MAG: GTP-binding protein [Roseburia sp.]